MVNCAVLMCKRRSKTSKLREHNVSYHKFPRDPTVRQEWRKFCNRSNKWYPTQTSAICSDHFTQSSFKIYSNIKRILNKGAIPTLRTCYCSKTKQEQHNKNEEPSKLQQQTSKKTPTKNVAISTCKKTKNVLCDKNKTIKKLRDNNRYLKNRVTTLKESVKKLQEKSVVIKEESTLEENETSENKNTKRSRNMSKDQGEVVLPTECGLAECRTCLQAIDNNSVLVDLFQCWVPPWDGMESTIAEDLAKLANVQITQTDKYSKVICEPCCLKLQSACDFAYIVRKNDRLLRQKHPQSPENIDNSNKTIWPKPIQIDKNINGTYENYGDVEIKQEVMSEDEYMDDNKEEMASLEIKIEPEELMQPMLLQPQENEQIDGAQSPYLELNGHVFHESKEEIPLTNGNDCKEDLLEIKEEPLSDIEDGDVIETDLPLVCMLCCKELNSVTGLKAHVIAQHSYKSVKRKSGSCSPEKRKRKQEFVCGTCQRRFMTSTDLMVHETCHNKSVCYACSAKVNNSKRERQKQYRERNRDKLKHREAERRKRIQSSQSIIGPSTSSNSNIMEVNNEEAIDGSEDVLFRRQCGHHLLGVKDEEEAEEDRSCERQRNLERGALKEDLNQTTYNEHAESSHQSKKIT
ncbi:THAP domain-containing protein 1 [Papilio machaon]|uniref:THAP domain-containing protein 1 n=1 Tax=Papilio machaon TaxID=76193 RepID=A0A194RK48_PAPMA|nr:THAP domain-containing protein 1 [Papilio machaon]